MKCARATALLAFVLLLSADASLGQLADTDEALSELEQVLSVEISTAARYEQTIVEAPSSVTIVTAEDIKRFGFETLADALRSVSGFYLSNDRNYTFVGVRGFSRPSDFNNRIRILLNGHAIYESMDGTTFAGSELAMSMDAVERIEIVRGPGSALYGTGAMLAVINIITKDSRTLDGLQLSTSSGSYGTQDISAVLSKTPSSSSSVLLSGKLSRRDGRKTLYYPAFDLATSHNGIAEGLDWEKGHAFTANAVLGRWRLNALYSNREKAIPTASYQTVFNDERTRSLDQYGFIEAACEIPLSARLQVTLRGYFDKYVYRGWWPYETEMAYDRTDGELIGAEGQFILDVASNHRILGVAEFQSQIKSRYDYWGDSSGLYIRISHPSDVASLTIQDEYRPTRSISLFAGLRLDSYGSQGSYSAPRIGIVYAPSRLTSIKAMYGRAFRVASAAERYYEDGNAGYKASPDLGAEDIVTRELAVQHQVSHHIQLSSSVYSYNFSDLVDYITDPTDSLLQLRNHGAADALGWELGLHALFSRRLSAFANYTLQRTEDSDTKERLSNSPQSMFKAGVWSSFLKYFSGSAQINYQTGRTTVYGTKTKSFLLTDLLLVLKPAGSQPMTSRSITSKLELEFRVRNAFDQSYSYPGGFEHVVDAIEQDGRTYQVKLNCRL